jgi:hypothetical protein
VRCLQAVTKQAFTRLSSTAQAESNGRKGRVRRVHSVLLSEARATRKPSYLSS